MHRKGLGKLQEQIFLEGVRGASLKHVKIKAEIVEVLCQVGLLLNPVHVVQVEWYVRNLKIGLWEILCRIRSFLLESPLQETLLQGSSRSLGNVQPLAVEVPKVQGLDKVREELKRENNPSKDRLNE